VGSLGVAPELVITASILDALAFWCAGIRNVTAACTSGHELVDAVRLHGIHRVILAFPRSSEGDAATAPLVDRHVAIKALKEVHERTHPWARLAPSKRHQPRS
jgi:hypothetical protein